MDAVKKQLDGGLSPVQRPEAAKPRLRDRLALRLHTWANRLSKPDRIESDGSFVPVIDQKHMWSYLLLKALNSSKSESLPQFLELAMQAFTNVTKATIYRRWNDHLEIDTVFSESREEDLQKKQGSRMIGGDSALFRAADADQGYLLDMKTKQIFFFDLVPNSFGFAVASFEIEKIHENGEFTLKLNAGGTEYSSRMPLPNSVQQIVIPIIFDNTKKQGLLVIGGEDLSPKGISEDVRTRKVQGNERLQPVEKWVSDATIRAACISSCIAHIIEHGFDGLTSLIPRSIFNRTLERRVEDYVSGKNKNNIMVLFIDADKFKDKNDRYGHAFGDTVLREVASAISVVRKDDVIGRYGGEEFVIMLNNCGEEKAITVAGRIREALRQLKFKARISPTDSEEDVTVSISIGIASLKTALAQNMEPARPAWLEKLRKAARSENEGTPQNNGILMGAGWIMDAADQAMYFIKNPDHDDKENGRRSRDGVGILSGCNSDGVMQFTDVTVKADALARENARGTRGTLSL